MTTAYYSTDLVQQTAGGLRTTWTLDAAMRPRRWTTESNASGTWTATATRLNHYDGTSDEPRWTVENTGTAAITRNVGAGEFAIEDPGHELPNSSVPATARVDRLRQRGSPVDAAIAGSHRPGTGPV